MKPDKILPCPFCGAKIVLEEDLKLRVVKTKTVRTTETYYFDSVPG
jgi:hypothetical protein